MGNRKAGKRRTLASPAGLVAVVAGSRAVAVTRNVGVSLIRLRLLMSRLRVAIDASKARVVGRNLVAIVADRTVMGNREIGVIERCAEPIAGGVASVASGRISRRNMIRNTPAECLRTVPSGLMAAVTGGIRGRKVVIVIDMARRARRGRMCACKSPSGRGVIEHAGIPSDGIVASGAKRSGETSGDVIGNIAAESCRAVPGRLMAAVAIGIGRGEVVIVVDVAKGAGRGRVRAGQRKAGGVVVERGGRPGDGVVAGGAIGCGESGAGRGVRGVVGLLPSGEMAAGVAAVGRGDLQVVIAADMALSAGSDFARRRELM